MLDIPVNIQLFNLYVSSIDTRTRVLQVAREFKHGWSYDRLMEEVKRLDEIKEKTEKLIWSA